MASQSAVGREPPTVHGLAVVTYERHNSLFAERGIHVETHVSRRARFHYAALRCPVRAGVGSARRSDGLAVGDSLRGHVALDRDWAVAFPKFWHRHYGKIVAFWAALPLAALTASFGFSTALAAFVHTMLAEYVSFIVILFALYTVSGGILVTGQLRGTPLTNTAILGIGTAIASVVGTTGASMILIRPILRANAKRRHNVHVIVFFIFLVANIGGSLTPLGDPPLFLGFLRGVDFFWTARHLWLQTAIAAVLVLAIFIVLDTALYRREHRAADDAIATRTEIRIRGGLNFILIGLIVSVILMTAVWKPGIEFDVYGTRLALQNLARDVGLLLIAFVSLWLTPNEHREEGGFTWKPIREAAMVFGAIFTVIIPVIAMLQAGREGVFASLLALATDSSGQPREAVFSG